MGQGIWRINLKESYTKNVFLGNIGKIPFIMRTTVSSYMFNTIQNLSSIFLGQLCKCFAAQQRQKAVSALRLAAWICKVVLAVFLRVFKHTSCSLLGI